MSEVRVSRIGFVQALRSRAVPVSARAQAAPPKPRHKEDNCAGERGGQGARDSAAVATPFLFSGKWTDRFR